MVKVSWEIASSIAINKIRTNKNQIFRFAWNLHTNKLSTFSKIDRGKERIKIYPKVVLEEISFATWILTFFLCIIGISLIWDLIRPHKRIILKTLIHNFQDNNKDQLFITKNALWRQFRDSTPRITAWTLPCSVLFLKIVLIAFKNNMNLERQLAKLSNTKTRKRDHAVLVWKLQWKEAFKNLQQLKVR